MLKDGQKDIMTIQSNGNKQTYHVAASIYVLRKAIRVHDAAFSSQGSFPDNCAQSVVPARIK